MKIFRILVLVVILAFVAFYSKLQKLESTSWVSSLPVSIYPINGDGSQFVNAYIDKLSLADFVDIQSFLSGQHHKYNELSDQPIMITLENELIEGPPAPPTSRNVFAVILWSLHMRWWSYQHASSSGKAQVDIYVIYHQPKEGRRLAHSLGLQKGLIGVVNAFAADDKARQNNIVITHELLHTVGATDKYSLETGQPIFPDGFAQAEQRYNQTKAEIMAGKVPISSSQSEMPNSLRFCVIGKRTAAEIGWIK